MDVNIFPARHLSKEIICRWTEIQKSNSELTSPFFCPDFTQLVAQARDDVFVAAINDGEAFFPFQRSRVGLGTPVGSPISDCHGLISPEYCRYDAIALLRACRLFTWNFDHALAGQSTFVPWRAAEAESYALDVSADDPILPDVAARCDKQIRKLEREFGKVEIDLETSDESILQLCLAWKSLQYQQSGAFDIFQVPWIRRLIQLIAARRGPDFAGLTSVLYAGGKPIAIHFGIRSEKTWHYWFPAYDRTFHRYSPGTILLMKMISGARDIGISTIDFGKGNEDYKRRLSNMRISLIEGEVTTSRFVAALCRGQASVVNLVRSGPVLRFMPDRMRSFLKQVRQRRRFG